MTEGPCFNIKAVVQQTGSKADTLRVWERRYGLPQPQRSSGGHRLYSQRDVQIVKWLMTRQEQGLSIKRAVDLWRQIEAEGRDPLQEPLTPPSLTAAPPKTTDPFPGAIESTLEQLREDWRAACLSYDEERAEHVLAQAFALFPAETVCLHLLQKAVAQIGDGWYEGKVTVQQEHYCTALATRRLEALLMATPAPARPDRILAACPPGEQHAFPLLLLTLLLRRRGWEVVFLGANVPVEQLEQTVAAVNPQLVILAAQRLPTAAALQRVSLPLRQAGVPMAYGGMIFNQLPALRECIPGHFLGPHLDVAPQVVETLLTTPRPVPNATAVPDAFRQAHDHFRRHQARIEADLGPFLDKPGLSAEYLAMANKELADNIRAALSLGNMAFLGGEFEWIKGLLHQRGLPGDSLHGYLMAYRDTAQKHLGEQGRPITDWLERVIVGSSRSIR